jgi:hypothetical protein
VEIGLEDANRYMNENKKLIKELNNLFGERFVLNTVDFNDVPPGAVRFITEPTIAENHDYIRITDID